ncbi:MAG: diguanylate cyclase [Oscillospiraceae bacterium]
MRIKKLLVILLILFIIIPSISTTFLASIQYNQRCKKLAYDNIVTTATLQSQNVSNLFDQLQVALFELGKNVKVVEYLDPVKKHSPEEDMAISTVLSRLIKLSNDQQKDLLATYIADKNNKIIATSSKDYENMVVTSVKNIQTTPSGSFVVSIIPGKKAFDGTPLTTISMPIYIKNSYVGFVTAVISPEFYNNLVNNDFLDGMGAITILAADDTVLATSSKNVSGTIYNMNNDNTFISQWRKLDFHKNPNGIFDYKYMGETHLSAYFDLPEAGDIKVICTMKKDIIDTPFEDIVLSISAYILVFAVIILILSWILWKRFISPLTDLTSSIKCVKNGDYSTRFVYEKDNEFNEIATTFNSLIDTIEENQAALQQSNGVLTAITANIPGGVFRCSIAENFPFDTINDSFFELIGCTAAEVSMFYDNNYVNTIYAADRKRVRETINRHIENGTPIYVEHRMVKTDGAVLWVSNRSKISIDSDGNSWLHCLLLDITSEKEAQNFLKQNEERLQIIFEQIDDIVCEMDVQKNVITFSQQWLAKFGYPGFYENARENLLNSPNIHPSDVEIYKKWLNSNYQLIDTDPVEIRIKTIDNVYIWCKLKSSLVYNSDGKPAHGICIITDISAEKAEIERLVLKTETDPLTGLYNKISTQEKIETILDASDNELNALIILDIDDFKSINDHYGHYIGDNCLVNTATILKNFFKTSDIIGRIGGDEFIIFTEDIGSMENLIQRIERLCECFKKEYSYGEVTVRTTCSIGVAVFPTNGDTFNELYRNADSALYYAKNSGKSRFEIYNEEHKGQSFVKNFDNEQMLSVKHQGFKENFSEYIFNLLYVSNDIPHTINSILKIIGKHYGISRVYIFENSSDNLFCSNTYEWCNNGVSSEMENLQNLKYTDIDDHDKAFDKNGIYYLNSVKDFSNKPLIEKQNIKSMVHCSIVENGKFSGYIGFDDCIGGHSWSTSEISTLSYVSKILSIFLERRTTSRRFVDIQDLVQASINLLDTWTCIIKPEDFTLLYISRTYRIVIPNAQVGNHCYDFCGEASGKICKECPIKKIQSQSQKVIKSASSEMYNANLKIWSAAEATKVSLSSGKEVYIIRSRYLR